MPGAHPGVHPAGHFQRHPLDPCIAIARRRPGETPDELARRLEAIGKELWAKYGGPPGGVRVDVEPDPVAVDPEIHQTALNYAARVARWLGMPVPVLNWFSRNSPIGEIYAGFYLWGWDLTGTVRREPTIWICDDLRGWLLALAIAEEGVHAQHDAHGLPQDEETVQRKAQRLARQLLLTEPAATLLAEVQP